MVPGRTIHGVKTLRASEQLFVDHFPGFAVVPGVLLIEMMAQSAGKCLDAESTDRGKAMLAQVRNALFRHWVRPDERGLMFAYSREVEPGKIASILFLVRDGLVIAVEVQ